jgi:hypothetical protein
MGLGWFLGSIAILSAGTYFLAYYVDHILNMAIAVANYFWWPSPRAPNEVSERAQEKTNKKDNRPPPNLWRNRKRSRDTDVERGKEGPEVPDKDSSDES